MIEFLRSSGIDGGQLTGIIIVGSICLVTIVCILAGVKAFRHKIEAELKGRMLEAGMSTEENQRVLAAGRAARGGC